MELSPGARQSPPTHAAVRTRSASEQPDDPAQEAERADGSAGIDQWQAVEGGFYYRSGDGQAHFLRGAAETPAEPR